MLENGLDTCNCPKKRCERHGQCEKCMEHHKDGKNLPYCKRKKAADSKRTRGRDR